MLPAFLTTLLWSISAVCAKRSSKFLGAAMANLSRLFLGAILLAVWAYAFGKGHGGGGFWFFVLSGVVGFGLGDLALYAALHRLGSRLTLLLAQCLAAPIAALIEWGWLGTTLTNAQIFWGIVILAGVSIALAPREHLHIDRKLLIAGVGYGVLAAFGQASGAVLSRKAYQVVHLAGQNVDGGTAAYQRIIGGLAIAAISFLLFNWGRENGGATNFRVAWKSAWGWVVANTLAGPTVGVSCYQWALATTPSGIVLPIVATTPLVVVPLAYIMEGDRPRPRSLVGGVIAVIGAVALALVR